MQNTTLRYLNRKQSSSSNRSNKEDGMVNLNQATSISEEELKNVMDYHPWSPEKIAQGQKVREALGAALKVIIENVPPSADRSAGIRKLRDCRMDCNSAITHDGAF
jgi:hypothetical protein